MLKKSTYTLRIDQSRSKSVEKCSVYIIIECSHDSVSNLDWLGLRFQNLPFSKSDVLRLVLSVGAKRRPRIDISSVKCL